MEASRITFTKETKKKMKKELDRWVSGRIRYEKLLNLSNEGKLSLAKTRKDIAKMEGYIMPEQEHRGTAWVGILVKRRNLIENIVGFNRNGRPEYEYSIGKMPDYIDRPTRKSSKKVTGPVKAPVIEQPILDIPNEQPTVTKVDNDSMKIMISYKDLKIELDNLNPDFARDVIVSLIDKAKEETCQK